MRNNTYISELAELVKAERVIRKAIDTYSINRKQRDYLFKQLQIIINRKNALHFKMEISERLSFNEKSRKGI